MEKELALEEIHESWVEAYRLLLLSYVAQFMKIYSREQHCLVCEADVPFVRFF